MQEAGFKIKDEFFPMPTHFTLDDCVLVEQAAGLTFEQFAANLSPDGEMDAKTLVGLFAVGVAHQRPRWSRETVASFVGSVDWSDFEQVEGDELPPAQETADEKLSPEPSDESTLSAEPKEEDPA